MYSSPCPINSATEARIDNDKARDGTVKIEQSRTGKERKSDGIGESSGDWSVVLGSIGCKRELTQVNDNL